MLKNDTTYRHRFSLVLEIFMMNLFIVAGQICGFKILAYMEYVFKYWGNGIAWIFFNVVPHDSSKAPRTHETDHFGAGSILL